MVEKEKQKNVYDAEMQNRDMRVVRCSLMYITTDSI